MGNRKQPFGYKMALGEIVIQEAEARLVQGIFRRYIAGESLNKLTEAHLNIENMVNKGKKDVAYTLLDVTGNVTDDLAVKLGAIEPAIRVRVL